LRIAVSWEPLRAGAAATAAEDARTLIGEDLWPVFLERRSFDLSRTIQACAVGSTFLQTARGIGFAVRLLAAF